MPAQQQHHVTTAYLSSGSVAVGQCAVKTAAGDGYVEATLDNRTAASRRTAGIAISAGDPNNVAFELQVVGEIPPSISGLGTGAAGPIRVSSTGTLERTTSYSASDDMCGRCDTDGTAYVCFPLIGLGSAFGAVASASPTASVQVSVADGTFRGLTGVFGSVDGALEIRETGEAAATTGTLRLSKSAVIRAASGDGTRNLTIFGHSVAGASSEIDIIIYGTSTASRQAAQANVRALTYVGLIAGNSDAEGSAIAPGFSGFTGTAATMKGFIARPNFYIGDAAPFSSATYDPWRSAVGIELHRAQVTPPTAAPTGGYFRRCNPSNNHPEVLLPGDDPSTGWRDLLGGASDETDNVIITATPGDDIDVTGVGSIESASASATVTIRSLTPPASGKAKRVAISNQNGDSATLVLEQDNGFTEEGGFKLSTGGNFSMPFGMTLWAVYSETAQRYLVTVPSLEPGA